MVNIGQLVPNTISGQPLRQIAANSGSAEPSVVLNRVKDEKGTFGWNAQNEEYGDMIKVGILDPTKVVRIAIQNAASIAGLMVTTEAMVAEKPKEEKMAAAPGAGMEDMDY